MPPSFHKATGQRHTRGCVAWRAGKGLEGKGAVGWTSGEEGSAQGEGGGPGGLHEALAPGWLPRALAPGQPAGKEPRTPAVAFSWVMGHHDSFHFRNTISGREIARFRGKNTTISSNSISTRGNYSNGDFRHERPEIAASTSERLLEPAQTSPPRPANEASAPS